MNKILLLLPLLTLNSQAKELLQSKWKRYTSPPMGISFEMPETWEEDSVYLEHIHSTSILHFRGPPNCAGADNPCVRISLSAGYTMGKKTFKEIIEAIIKRYEKDGSTILKRESIQLGNRDAARIVRIHRSINNPDSLVETIFYVNLKNILVSSISYSELRDSAPKPNQEMSPKDWRKRHIFDRMLKSVKFLPPEEKESQ